VEQFLALYLFIYFLSVSHDGYVAKKQKQKHNKIANYETETNQQKTNSSSLSGGFYPFGG
jgi:hypothetical protein